MSKKGDKGPLPFLLDTWGSGGRRFKYSHPDFELRMKWSGQLSGPIGKVSVVLAKCKAQWHTIMIVSLIKEENNERS